MIIFFISFLQFLNNHNTVIKALHNIFLSIYSIDSINVFPWNEHAPSTQSLIELIEPFSYHSVVLIKNKDRCVNILFIFISICSFLQFWFIILYYHYYYFCTRKNCSYELLALVKRIVIILWNSTVFRIVNVIYKKWISVILYFSRTASFNPWS